MLLVVVSAACLVEDTPGYGLAQGEGSGSAGTPDTVLPPAGYQPRACGFDLDDDGERGEPDDCRICDGSTLDPDGDGVLEDLYYVDCDVPGGDTPQCGAPGAPCSSIKYAVEERIPFESWSNGAEDIVCFRGTCEGEESILLKNGVPAVFTRAPRGSERIEFDYPRDPAMIVGWDADGDGEYPPFDPDDRAVLDGGPAGLARAFSLNSAGTFEGASRDIELAHFTIQGYRIEQGAGLVDGAFTGPFERIYFHDLVLDSLAKDLPVNENGLFEFPTAGNDQFPPPSYSYIALENLDIRDHGGFILIEPSTHFDSGPLRIANWTTVGHGCDASGPAQCADPSDAVVGVWDAPGFIRDVEIIDSVFDVGAASWSPWVGSGPDVEAEVSGPTAIRIGECNQGVLVRNNRFVGYATAVTVSADVAYDAIGCARSVDDIRIEANVITHEHAGLVPSTLPLSIRSADPNDEATLGIGEVVVTNNFMSAEHAWQGCVWVRMQAGSSAERIAFIGNTCVGDFDGPMTATGAALVRLAGPGAAASSMVVRNNILQAGGVDPVLTNIQVAPGGWDADHNVFAPGASLAWAGSAGDLASWRSRSGGDPNAVECTPQFESSEDLHLAASDDCATDAAQPVDGITLDVDGQTRPAEGPWDAGADERIEE